MPLSVRVETTYVRDIDVTGKDTSSQDTKPLFYNRNSGHRKVFMDDLKLAQIRSLCLSVWSVCLSCLCLCLCLSVCLSLCPLSVCLSVCSLSSLSLSRSPQDERLFFRDQFCSLFCLLYGASYSNLQKNLSEVVTFSIGITNIDSGTSYLQILTSQIGTTTACTQKLKPWASFGTGGPG